LTQLEGSKVVKASETAIEGNIPIEYFSDYTKTLIVIRQHNYIIIQGCV